VIEAMRDSRIDSPELADRYVLGVCRNLVSHSRRSAQRARAFEDAVRPLSVAELPPAYSELDATRLAFCLGQLGRRAQRVITATFQEDRSATEIAADLQTSPGNVRVLRHRAMASLQRCVERAAS